MELLRKQRVSVAVVASAESYVDPDSGIIVEDVETLHLLLPLSLLSL